MSYCQPPIFGKSPWDLTPRPTNYQGCTGWRIVPCGWFTRRNADGTITASPNADFSAPNYDVKTDTDGYMKFFSMGIIAQTTPM
jgi:hypothetical protein